MQKRKEAEASLIIRGEADRGDLGTLICDALLLGVFFYNQIFYGLDMWFVILPLLAIGLYLVFFGIIPDQYHFTETALEVRHLFCKTVSIPYVAVFNLEAKERDNFVNLLQENKVKVYYAVGNAKKLTVCKPRDVYAFVQELKKRCPEFDEDGQESKLKPFFEE